MNIEQINFVYLYVVEKYEVLKIFRFLKIKNNADSYVDGLTNSSSSQSSRQLREQREYYDLKHTNVLDANNGNNLNTTTNEFHNYDACSFGNTSSPSNNKEEADDGNLLERGKVLVRETKDATSTAETAGQKAVRDSEDVTSSVNELHSKEFSVSAEIKHNEDKSVVLNQENEQLQADTEYMQSELSAITQDNNIPLLDFSGSIIAQPVGSSMNMFAMNSLPNVSAQPDTTSSTNSGNQSRANDLISKIEDNKSKIGNNNITIKNYGNTNKTLSSNFRQFSQNVSNNAQTKLDAVKEGNDFAKFALTTGEKATKLGQMIQKVGPGIDGAIGGPSSMYEMQGDILTCVGTIATGVGQTADGETKSGIKTIYSGLQQSVATYNKYNDDDDD